MPGKRETNTVGRPGRLRAWLELLRVPNLLTVPGDAVAGYLVAAGAAAGADVRLCAAAGAGLALYGAGLVLNDVADVEVDRAERPARPLPSGRIPVGAARLAGFLLLAAGLAAASALGRRGLLAAALLAIIVVGYDLSLKRSAVLGPLALGLCRSLNMVLGAAIVGAATQALVAASVMLNAYVVSVSYLAHGEMRARRRGWVAWLPALVVIGGMAAFVRVAPVDGENRMRMAGAFFFAFVVASGGALRLQDGRGAAEAVGLMLGGLIPLQAAFALGAGAGVWSVLAGFCLVLLWPLNRLLARGFHAS